MPRDQLVLFTDTLESRIPQGHPVRLLDEILETVDWTTWEAKYHGAAGQPPIHPRVMASVLLFAMIRRVRSSRQIEYQIRHSIDFMWLVSGRTIDHDTLSRFRRAHANELKDVYRQLIRTAIRLGMAQLSELCIDGSRVMANANRYQTWTADRIEKTLSLLDQQIAEALTELESSDELDEALGHEQTADQLPPELSDLKKRREQLAVVQAQLQEMDEQRRKDGKDPATNPAQLFKSDPDARMLLNKEGGYAANYTPMAITETQNGFIVGADVLIGNAEHQVMLSMVEEIETTFDVNVDSVLADTAYSTGENLVGAEAMGLELIAPLASVPCPANPAHRDDPTQPIPSEQWDQLPNNPSTKLYDKTAFVYDEQQDCYYCPAGKKLPRTGEEKRKRGNKPVVIQIIYMCSDCAGCPQADRCRKDPQAAKGRRVTDDQHEPARRRHRTRMQRPEIRETFKQRKTVAERPFAILKTLFGMRRFLLRGITGVHAEWLWGCTAHNLLRLMTEVRKLRAKDMSISLQPQN
ncbi:MAG: IS1182 family transposase [Planctomycetales bacterium]|nr:IS1182 family transposase [Planctomycetales bacterium]MCA9169384.1 IS1182 family transposase [Planctomycetales bacterium]